MEELRRAFRPEFLNRIDDIIVFRALTEQDIEEVARRKSGRIQRYIHIRLKDKGLSTREVRDIHTLLNNCLEQAVAERPILSDPAKGCRLPKLEKREMKILPEDKIGPYLAEAERRGLMAAFYKLIYA